jgi:hypothetical protein
MEPDDGLTISRNVYLELTRLLNTQLCLTDKCLVLLEAFCCESNAHALCMSLTTTFRRLSIIYDSGWNNKSLLMLFCRLKEKYV